jgi:uncharacterized protein
MSGLDLNSVTVIHNEGENRFEAIVKGRLVIATYRMYPGRILFDHTEVPEPLEGQGLAGKLIGTALDYARANHLLVLATCSYVRNFLRKHPEYQDIVAPEQWKKIAPVSLNDAGS